LMQFSQAMRQAIQASTQFVEVLFMVVNFDSKKN
jgi:hypothetical protein